QPKVVFPETTAEGGTMWKRAPSSLSCFGLRSADVIPAPETSAPVGGEGATPPPQPSTTRAAVANNIWKRSNLMGHLLWWAPPGRIPASARSHGGPERAAAGGPVRPKRTGQLRRSGPVDFSRTGPFRRTGGRGILRFEEGAARHGLLAAHGGAGRLAKRAALPPALGGAPAGHSLGTAQARG